MIITNLELENFGQHANFQENFENASIVGLTGNSGSGKTTILKAIEYAFTGKLPGKANEWVRYGEKKASIVLNFKKSNKFGELKRKITSTTASRELTWDGVTYTAAKSVDNMLNELFGSDKEAISNAVFINQGELHKILYGSDVERCNLFIKLVNLNYCEKHAERIDAYISKLKKGIEDLSPVIDRTQENLNYYENELKSAKEKYEQNKGFNEKLENLKEYKRLSHELESLQQEKNVKQKTLDDLEKKYGSNKQEIIKTAQKELETLNSQQEELNSELTNYQEEYNSLQNYEQINSEIENIQNQLQELTKQLKDNHVNTSEDPKKELETYNREQQILTSLKANYLLKEKIESELSSLKTSFNQLQEEKPTTDEQQLADLQLEENKLHLEIQTLDQWLNVQKEIKEKGVCDCENKCIKCGLELSTTAKIDNKSIENLENLIKEKNELLETKRKEYKTQKDAFYNYQQKEQELRNSINEKEKQLQNTKSTIENEANTLFFASVEQIDKDLNNVETHIQNLNNFIALKDSIDSKREVLSSTLVEKTQTQVTLKEKLVGFNFSKAETCLQKINKIKYQRKNISAEIQNKQNEINTLTEEYNQLQQAKNKLENVITNINNSSNKIAKFTDINTGNEEELSKQEEELKKKVEIENEFKGKYDTLIEQRNREKQELDKLKERAKQFDEKNKKIKSLERLKSVFQRDGLPMKCVNDYFGQLCALTQQNLESMNVDFVVKVDETKPVAFAFQKMTDPTRTWQGQHKFSGGEKVRVSVAFLIALQQLLLPDFGFLVLDEPSQHLNEEAKNNMAELFTQMTGKLRNMENQIWMSDHSTELTNAADKTISMT